MLGPVIFYDQVHQLPGLPSSCDSARSSPRNVHERRVWVCGWTEALRDDDTAAAAVSLAWRFNYKLVIHRNPRLTAAAQQVRGAGGRHCFS